MVEQDPESLILIGRVFRAHGIRGELKVIPETDEPERFSGLDQVYLGNSAGEAEPFEIDGARYQPKKHGISVVLKLSGIDTREAAETLGKTNIYAREDDLPPLEEDEVFLHDLIGMDVITEEGERVGVVEDVLEMPAHPVYVVRREGASKVMIPDVREIVLDIDQVNNTLVIKPIEGLLE